MIPKSREPVSGKIIAPEVGDDRSQAPSFAAAVPQRRFELRHFLPRLIAGLAILLAWEFVVRAFAPAYVAKPTTVVLAIPRVIVDPLSSKPPAPR